MLKFLNIGMMWRTDGVKHRYPSPFCSSIPRWHLYWNVMNALKPYKMVWLLQIIWSKYILDWFKKFELYQNILIWLKKQNSILKKLFLFQSKTIWTWPKIFGPGPNLFWTYRRTGHKWENVYFLSCHYFRYFYIFMV